jgi:hypothetical protein
LATSVTSGYLSALLLLVTWIDVACGYLVHLSLLVHWLHIRAYVNFLIAKFQSFLDRDSISINIFEKGSVISAVFGKLVLCLKNKKNGLSEKGIFFLKWRILGIQNLRIDVNLKKLKHEYSFKKYIRKFYSKIW